jgi:hypothetical protein
MDNSASVASIKHGEEYCRAKRRSNVSHTMEAHPLAGAYPEMQAIEFEALKLDIQEHGLKEPIIVFENKILDGRNRYRACAELGITPKLEQFCGDYEQARKFSASANLMRRHLKQSQKAMIIAQSGLAAAPTASPKEDRGKMSVREAAARFGVNHQTCYKAFFVLSADGELAGRVLAGELSVGRAEAILRSRGEAKRRYEGKRLGAEDVVALTRRINRLAKTTRNTDRLAKVVSSLRRLESLLSTD